MSSSEVGAEEESSSFISQVVLSELIVNGVLTSYLYEHMCSCDLILKEIMRI